MNPWLVIRKPKVAPTLRLFCFPFAGGSAGTYARWPDALPSTVEVIAIQPPGRGSRFRETPLALMSHFIDELCPAVIPYLDRPFVFFGYSMGAHTAFELARALRRLEVPGLQHLILAAERGPQLSTGDGSLHTLPRDQFLEHIRGYSGTSDEIFDTADLLDAFLPALRADFAISELYRYVSDRPLTCNATLFGGLSDPYVPHADLLAWQGEIAGRVTCELFSGGHFFINDCTAAVLASVNRIVGRVLDSLVSSSEQLVD